MSNKRQNKSTVNRKGEDSLDDNSHYSSSDNSLSSRNSTVYMLRSRTVPNNKTKHNKSYSNRNSNESDLDGSSSVSVKSQSTDKLIKASPTMLSPEWDRLIQERIKQGIEQQWLKEKNITYNERQQKPRPNGVLENAVYKPYNEGQKMPVKLNWQTGISYPVGNNTQDIRSEYQKEERDLNKSNNAQPGHSYYHSYDNYKPGNPRLDSRYQSPWTNCNDYSYNYQPGEEPRHINRDLYNYNRPPYKNDHYTDHYSSQKSQNLGKRNFRCPTFSGKYADWKVFTILFEQAGEVNRWDEKEKLFNLINSMEGEARAFISAMDEDARQITVSKLMAKLDHRFGSGRNPQHYEALLMSKYWTLNTDPRQYADEIRQLVSRSYLNCPADYKEDLVKRHFIMSIQDCDLRCQIGLQELSSLEALISFVERWVNTQAVLKQRKSQNSIRMVAPCPDSDEDYDGESESECEQVQYMPNSRNRYSKKSYSGGYKNNYTGQKNYNDSWENRKNKSYSSGYNDHHNYKNSFSRRYNTPKESEERDWKRVKCYFCGGIGHMKQECPSRERIGDSLNGERPTLGGEEAKRTITPQS